MTWRFLISCLWMVYFAFQAGQMFNNNTLEWIGVVILTAAATHTIAWDGAKWLTSRPE